MNIIIGIVGAYVIFWILRKLLKVALKTATIVAIIGGVIYLLMNYEIPFL